MIKSITKYCPLVQQTRLKPFEMAMGTQVEYKRKSFCTPKDKIDFMLYCYLRKNQGEKMKVYDFRSKTLYVQTSTKFHCGCTSEWRLRVSY